MSKLQLIDARKMEKFLLNLGFEKTRQKGSHAFFRHKDGRTTTVPYQFQQRFGTSSYKSYPEAVGFMVIHVLLLTVQ